MINEQQPAGFSKASGRTVQHLDYIFLIRRFTRLNKAL